MPPTENGNVRSFSTRDDGMKRIVALVPSTQNTNPGQRTRIEFWAARLPQFGWSVDFYPFDDGRLREVLHQQGAFLAKGSSLLTCYGRQLRRVLRLPPCDA